MNPSWWSEIARPIRQKLLALGFAPDQMEALRQQVLAGTISHTGNYCITTPQAPTAADLSVLPEHDSPDYRYYYELGCHTLAAGKVGVAILNGGMATRFGGVVKGAVVVDHNRSFLQLKLDDIRGWQQRLGGRIPVFIVNSFATDLATQDHLRYEQGVEIHYLQQGVSLRLSPDGQIFFFMPGQPSLYAPGHGDMLRAWRNSPEAMEWSREEGRILLVGNVDNLHFMINPAIIGMMINQRNPIMAEVVQKYPRDRGGAPAWYKNHLQTIESFRFPPEFDQNTINVFATNNFAIRTAILLKEWVLDWFYVVKEAHGQKLVQLEKIINQLTSFVPTSFLVVPRVGVDGRFMPVKNIDDMSVARRTFLRNGTRGI